MSASERADHSGPAQAVPNTGVVTARALSLMVYVRSSIEMVGRRRPAVPWLRLPARRLAIHSGLTICAIALSMAVLDAPAFAWASRLPPWAVDWFYQISDFGRSGWLLIPVGGITLVTALAAASIADHMARGALATLVIRLSYIFVAVGLPGLINTIVKRWIGRERPSLHGPFAYVPLSWRPEFASFPSGHTTSAFAALVAIGSLYPRLRPLLWTCALLIAASRVAVTAHYPSDVIAGAATGAFGAFCVRQWFTARRLGFSYGADGSIHPKPAASWRRIAKAAGTLLAA